MPDTHPAPPVPLTGIDSHAHIFARGLPLAQNRRYAPSYDATLDAYLAMLACTVLSHGVLVQPSFLGTDNSYMVAALRRLPDRLRGIAVVRPEIEDAAMRALDEAGCVGARLNLIGRPDPAFKTAEWQAHLHRLAAFGWQIEVQAEAARLPRLLPPLLAAGLHVVVDHFGRPDMTQGIGDPGFRFLLHAAESRRVWVKLSGAYRLGRSARGEEIARQAAPLLLAHFGAGRLLWGSDWPHTQHEGANDAQLRGRLDAWVPDASMREAILRTSPGELFRFTTPALTR